MAYTASMDEFRTEDRYEAMVAGPGGVADVVLLKKARSGGFSWCTLFLGALYWAYRRCYVEAGVLVAFNVLVSFLPESPAWLVLSLATSVVLGFAFPYVYRLHADRLYAKGIAQPQADERSAIAYVRAHGGTSWAGVFALMAAVFAIAFIEVIMMGSIAAPVVSASAF